MAADYQPSAPECVRFFQVMQNKIQCGKAHFEALQVREAPAQYVVVRTFDDLMARFDS